MKHSTAIALLFSTVMATTSISSFAAPEHGHRGHGPVAGWHMDQFKGLDLTDAQKEQMKNLKEQYRSALVKGDSKAEMLQLKALVQADQFDEAAVRALFEAKQKDRLEQDVAMAKLQYELHQVLTAEQKAKLAERQQKWQEKAKERKSKA
jgi:protein CpxP